MNRAYSLLEIKSVQEDQRIIVGTATTPSPDRMGDIVEPLGVKFNNPLPLLWQHDSALPVGQVRFKKPTKNGIDFEATLPVVKEAGPLKDRVDTAWQEVKYGLVKGVSIGFRGLERSALKDGGIRFIESEVLELSLVTIPANAEATIQTIKSIDSELLAASGHKRISVERAPAGVTAATPPVTAKEAKRTMSKRTLADAIASWEATLKQKETELDQVESKALESDDTLDADDKDKIASLKIDLKEVEDQLRILKDRQARSVASASEVKGADPVQASQSRTVPAQVRATPKPLGNGTGFIRFVQTMINAKGNVLQAERLAMAHANRWEVETPGVVDLVKYAAELGHTRFDMELVSKAAVAAGSTTDSTWASPLVVYQNLQNEFIEYLRGLTVIGRIPGLRRVPFKVKVPRQTGGSTVGWVGERSVKPVTSLAFDTVTLEFTKLAAIVVISEELARFGNPSAEAIIRQDLGDAIVAKMDVDFTDPTVAAVTGVSPASITNGVTPVTASGTTAAALRADLKNVLDNYLALNMPLSGIVGIMTQSQALAISLMQTSLGTAAFPGLTAQGGTLAGIPIITSENMTATGGSPTDGYPIIFLRARDILLADDGQVTIDTSNQASLQMDTAPTSPPTGDTVPFSLWQHDCVGIRAERFVNWVVGRTGAVQFIQNAKYAE